jgi:hypothetical protein
MRRHRTNASEIEQLRATVRSLQKESKVQLSLELESQASFEHIYAQVRGLRGAFDTLSDVLLEEVDSIRAESSKRFTHLSTQMEKHDRTLETVVQDLGVLKKTMEVWGLKERDWAKDNEILKVSHAHNAEWMKSMQRDLMEIKDEMRAVKDGAQASAKDMREEVSSLRAQWEQSVEKFNGRVRDLQGSVDRQQVEIRGMTDQRVDDYELLQKAMSALQQQHHRSRTSIEEGHKATRVDIRSAVSKIGQMESTMQALKIDAGEVRRRINDMSSDNHLQFENVSRVFKTISDAMDLTVSF